MADRPWVLVDLVVISSLVGLVAEKVDSRVFDSAWLLGLSLEMCQAVSLIPAVREDIERDGASNGKTVFTSKSTIASQYQIRAWNSRQPQIRKLLPQNTNKSLSDLVLLIILIERIPLLHTSIPSNGRDINHAIPKLYKRAPLNGNIQIRDVMQDKLDELLVLVLAQPLDKRVRRERDAELEGREPVLREAEVEERSDVDGRGAELFLLLG